MTEAERIVLLEKAASYLFDGYFFLRRDEHGCKLLGPVPMYGEYKPCQCLPCRIQYLKKELYPDPETIDVSPLPISPTWLIKK